MCMALRHWASFHDVSCPLLHSYAIFGTNWLQQITARASSILNCRSLLFLPVSSPPLWQRFLALLWSKIINLLHVDIKRVKLPDPYVSLCQQGQLSLKELLCRLQNNYFFFRKVVVWSVWTVYVDTLLWIQWIQSNFED